MPTSDDFPVSGLTKMCEYHGEYFASLAVQVLDAPNDEYPGGGDDRVNDMREMLAELRATCLDDCGRTEE